MSSESVSVTSERLTGRVKWFNNKAGYGFITITEGEQSGTDVFVNHRSIVVSTPQYIYLVQGEYVSFTLVPAVEDKFGGKKHEFQAGSVSGVNGGLLMCETRREFRLAKPVESTGSPIQKSASVRGSGPREGVEWNESVPAAPVATPAKKRGRPPRQQQQQSSQQA